MLQFEPLSKPEKNNKPETLLSTFRDFRAEKTFTTCCSGSVQIMCASKTAALDAAPICLLRKTSCHSCNTDLVGSKRFQYFIISGCDKSRQPLNCCLSACCIMRFWLRTQARHCCQIPHYLANEMADFAALSLKCKKPCILQCIVMHWQTPVHRAETDLL